MNDFQNNSDTWFYVIMFVVSIIAMILIMYGAVVNGNEYL